MTVSFVTRTNLQPVPSLHSTSVGGITFDIASRVITRRAPIHAQAATRPAEHAPPNRTDNRDDRATVRDARVDQAAIPVTLKRIETSDGLVIDPKTPTATEPSVPIPPHHPSPIRDPEGIGTEFYARRVLSSVPPSEQQRGTPTHHPSMSYTCDIKGTSDGDLRPTLCQRRKRGRAKRKTSSCISSTETGPSARRNPGPIASSHIHFYGIRRHI